MKQSQTGMGLLELMFALAIIALLILSAIKYYQGVKVSSSINVAMNQISSLIGASERWAAGHQGSFLGMTHIQTLKEAELIPAELTQHEWGGRIEVKALTAYKIQLSLFNLPSTACYHLGQKLKIPETELDKQCVVTSKIPTATLLYCYPDQENCL